MMTSLFLFFVSVLTVSPTTTELDESAKVSVTIVYDNMVFDNRLAANWGFSCVIKGFNKVVLFDTGYDGSELLGNMRVMGIEPAEIDLIVLSHVHRDHTGGLEKFLEKNSEVAVYIPSSFYHQLKSVVTEAGGQAVEVSDRMELVPGLWTTGELKGPVLEQAVYFQGKEGLVLVTGCAHPGIANMAEHVVQATGSKMHMVLGGFHLGDCDTGSVEAIINKLKKFGVAKVLPTHCTGEGAIRLFRQAFSLGFINGGLGSVIEMPLP
jgi:7,8-dihydropterin-6-yl-methyl-4-(beta-D-ribofuranosyl)aminobenzene 5'-phosphate synthase